MKTLTIHLDEQVIEGVELFLELAKDLHGRTITDGIVIYIIDAIKLGKTEITIGRKAGKE